MVSFSEALIAAKQGKKISRQAWNGNGMFLYKTEIELPYPPLPNGEAWKSGEFDKSSFIVMKTADEKLIPWVASQADILAEDWVIVEIIYLTSS